MNKFEIKSKILNSPNKVKILEYLIERDEECLISEIEDETKIYRSHISTNLKELVNIDFVKILNPNSRTYKFFKITENGKKDFKKIKLLLK